MADRTCSIDGCERKHYGLGFCELHWKRQRAITAPRCSIDDCDRAVVARGYCKRHYADAIDALEARSEPR